MAIIVNQIKTGINEPTSIAIDRALSLLGVSKDAVKQAGISKTSLDARRRAEIHFVHAVSVSLFEGEQQVAARAGSQAVYREEQPLEVVYGERPLSHRPVIVGFGPAGMFAGLLLARNGYRPMILERGSAVEKRVAAVDGFWQHGILDPNTNVQFGEGGAGTFSDGKLTTRIGDPKCGWVLQELVQFGAPAEILQKAKPHIGTDRLRAVVRRIREEILSLGGEVRFETTFTGLKVQNGVLQAVETQAGEIPTQTLILAMGHSARDTFEMLHTQGLEMHPKPFSVGVRIEHLQSEIDKGLYGALAGHPALPVGEYQLSWREGNRGVYSFCMCPGGFVVPAASELEMVATNGMSCFARDQDNANAAMVVSVDPEDYGNHPLAGIAFQRDLERRAFQAGGGDYRAPAQDVGSFLRQQAGLKLGRVQPSYARGITPGNFYEIFPEFVTERLQDGLQRFDRKLKGYAASDAIMTGVETRTSSPVRILRKENHQSTRVEGIYPCAEGAGYAGGIMSAAVDGLRCALAVMQEYRPQKG